MGGVERNGGRERGGNNEEEKERGGKEKGKKLVGRTKRRETDKEREKGWNK